VEAYARDWQALRGRIDDQRFTDVLAQLNYQAGQAQVWRDAVVTWFWKASGIPDALGRAGHHPGRIEAESMQLDGYLPRKIQPWEAASGETAVVCPAAKCTATARFDGAPGWYTVRVQYFDLPAGVSKFRLLLNHQLLDEWNAADRLPARKLDASASVRREVQGIALRPGDELHIEGTPDATEPAALDYLELLPAN